MRKHTCSVEPRFFLEAISRDESTGFQSEFGEVSWALYNETWVVKVIAQGLLDLIF